jgi:hypothetical protein
LTFGNGFLVYVLNYEAGLPAEAAGEKEQRCPPSHSSATADSLRFLCKWHASFENRSWLARRSFNEVEAKSGGGGGI